MLTFTAQDLLSICSSYPTVIKILTTFIPCFLTYYLFYPTWSQKQYNVEQQSNVIEEELQSKATPEAKEQTFLLSLIIPAYNEEERLPPMFLSTIKHLHSSKEKISQLCIDILSDDSGDGDHTKFAKCKPFEILIVNDGSKDSTIPTIKYIVQQTEHNPSKDYSINDINIRVFSLKQNCGKGAAVKVGMLNSNGKLCLMVDADGATNFLPSLLELLNEMKQMKEQQQEKQDRNDENMIVFGSRAHLSKDSKAKRSPVRTVLMIAFHMVVKTLCSNSIQDTQCGFKLFTSDAAEVLFGNLHLNRWAFDTEIVIMAEKLGIPIREVGVEWKEVDGSKLAVGKLGLLIASIEMFRDMLCVRVMYTLGLWRLKTQNHAN